MPESSQYEEERKTRDRKEAKEILGAMAAGTALGAAPEIINTAININTLRSPTDPRNIFESANHIKTPDEYDKVADRFDKGDPDAHVWNEETVTRLASFNPRLQVLTIDSLAPSWREDKYHTKKDSWLKLPARPSRINPTGFYAVAGDIVNYVRTMQYATPQPGAEYEKEFFDMLNAMDRNERYNPLYSDYFKNQEDQGSKARTGGAVLATLGAAAAIALKKKESTMGRRAFINTLMGAGTGLAAYGVLQSITTPERKTAQAKAAHAQTEKDKEYWQTLTAALDSIPPWEVLDGRTALMIAKHEDAMQYLRDDKYILDSAQGAMIMGYSHTHKGILFMHDKKARDKAILTYAKNTIEIANTIIFPRYNIPEEDKRMLTRRVLHYFALTQINSIYDPGLPPGVSMDDYVETNIRRVDTFPSPQVQNAIKSIYPALK